MEAFKILTTAAAAAILLSSCGTESSSCCSGTGQVPSAGSNSMPGMTAAEHAAMKKN